MNILKFLYNSHVAFSAAILSAIISVFRYMNGQDTTEQNMVTILFLVVGVIHHVKSESKS